MTEAELQALVEAHGGEVGGYGQGRHVDPSYKATVPRTMQVTDPETGAPTTVTIHSLTDPNPTPPTWFIETKSGKTIKVQPQPDGTYVPVDVPAAPSVKSDVFTIPGRGLGRLTPEGGIELIPGSEPGTTARAGSWQGGVYYEQDTDPKSPTYGQQVATGVAPGVLTAQQQAADRAAATAQQTAETQARQTATAQQTAETQRLQTLATVKRDELAAKRDEQKLTDTQAQQEWDNWWKQNVELPQQKRAAEDVLLGKGIEYGQTAGTSAVSDVTATLPYRYSPGFSARQQAIGAEAARGNFAPGIYQPTARGYRGPDLPAVRQQAEQQYQNQYLTQFGFDPLETAAQVGYRAPGAGAPPPVAVGDDESRLKDLARQLAGG